MVLSVIVKAPPCVCTENKAQGACQDASAEQGKAECCICFEASPECCIFCTHNHKHRQCLSAILCARTMSIFGDQTSSKLFLVIEKKVG